MTQSVKLTPNLDEKTTKVLNLTVLQRIDPYVEEILLTAAHVTFYEFNIENNQWSRKGVEGSLFVVKRNDQPRFQFIVMNRRNTDNLVEDLLGISNMMCRILSAYAKVPSKSKVSSTQGDFKELETVPTLATTEGPLEPPSTAGNFANDPQDSAFINFFNTAMNIGAAPNIARSHSIIPPTQTQIGLSATLPAAQNQTNTAISSLFSSILGSAQLNTGAKADPVRQSSLFSPPSLSPPLIMPVISVSRPSAPPLNPPVNLHRPYGTPLLQPFPPPTPLPPSLTPTTITDPRYGSFRRETVQQALQSLIQDDQFIDMVYRAMTSSHK